MPATSTPPPWLRRLAWACVVLVAAVVTLSAFIRLAGGGDSAGVAYARLVHRLVASAAMAVAIVLLVRCYMAVPALARQGRLALGVVALGAMLAVVGRMGGDSQSAAVVLTNMFGGLAMLSLSVGLALSLGP